MVDEPEAPRSAWTEIANAVVIAIAGLLISFASYQAALWSGEEELGFSRANVLHTESAESSARGGTREAVAVQLFSQWFNAAARGETKVADMFAARFPPKLRIAFDAWSALRPFDNPAAPPSPFSMPQYVNSEAAEAEALQAQANASFKLGQAAKRIADTYGQAVTILSTALFFAGISQVFRLTRVRFALLALAAFACAIAMVRIITLPIMTLFSSPS
jgi:hypothetical protein